MSIERYDENGEVIYAPEGGPLKNLWKYMAIINNESSELNEAKEKSSFDYNEFFKRLCLSRTELDVTTSVLQLLLKEGDGNISIEAVHHENDEENKQKISSTVCFGLKMEFLKEISRDLRKSSESLYRNRQEEHEIVSGVLLELREKFRWNLTRILSSEQVQVTLNFEETTPIIGIDYSPQVLFKDNSLKGEQQHNYNLQIGGENLALVLRAKSGDLSLLFQSKQLEKSKIFKVKNVKTGRESSITLFHKFDSKILFGSNVEEWNEALKDARNQSICLNILKLLAQEAAKNSKDQVLLEETNLKVLVDNTVELSFLNEIESSNEDETEAENIYKQLLFNYFTSSGRELNWTTIRKDLLQ